MPDTREKTEARQSAFLMAYARSGTIMTASKAERISRETVYD